MNFKKIGSLVAKKWHFFLLFFLGVSFFIGTSSFNYLTQNYAGENGQQLDFVKWASPDETANYLFAKLYAQENKLTITENYNLIVHDIIRPRSVRSDHGEMKPVSFLGMILIYGKIGQVFGYKTITYLTPLFGAIGIFYFYLLIRKLFNKNTALISAFLLAAFPPYFYYTSRSMFHNVPFMALLIIGLYYCIMMEGRRHKKLIDTDAEQIYTVHESWDSNTITNRRQKFKIFFQHFISLKTDWILLINAALAGFFIGLANAIRTSELLWVAPLLVVLWLFNIKKIGVAKLFIFLTFFCLALLPVAYYNEFLYGNFYFGGYGEMNRSIINLAEASTNLVKSIGTANDSIYKEWFYKIKDNIFFFGFHPRQSWFLLNKYFINMFFWLFWSGLAGLIFMILNCRNYKYRRGVYLVSYFLISTILVIYYGSWEFHDNPDPNSFTIGNSYTRYWLPVYLGAIPLVSYLAVSFIKIICDLLVANKYKTKKFFSVKARKIFFVLGISGMMAAIIIFVSMQYTLFGSEEGLVYLAERQKGSKREWAQVLDSTENNSVIITQYHDKLLFPERKVIVGLFDDNNMIAEYAKLAGMLPVYYYNFTFPDKDLDYLNSRRLAGFNLNLQPVKLVTSDFTLYKLNLSYQSYESLPKVSKDLFDL